MNPHRIVQRLAEINRIIAYWQERGDERAALLEIRPLLLALHTDLQDSLDREAIARELRQEYAGPYTGGGAL